MAKGKHAAALFEVIHAAKQKQDPRSKTGGLLTPSWWFKRRGGPPAEPAAKPNKHEAKQPAIAPVERSSEPEPVEAAPPEAIQEIVEPPVIRPTAASTTYAPEVVENDFDTQDEDEPSIMDDPEPVAEPVTALVAPTPPKVTPDRAPIVKVERTPVERAPRSIRRPVNVAFDRLRNQIDLHLSYTSAAISAFGFIVVVALAFMVGRSLSRGPTQAGAATIEETRKGQAFPGVLNVNAGKTGANEEGTMVAPAPKQATKVAVQPQTSPPAVKPAPSQVVISGAGQQTPPVAANGKRLVGMQYVCMRSYYDFEDANDAAAALNEAGIAVTVEKNLWIAPACASVIGTRAFARTKGNAEYDAYIQSITAVSSNLASNRKYRHVEKFDPKPIGWKEQAK